jgi:hypothetical protein
MLNYQRVWEGVAESDRKGWLKISHSNVGLFVGGSLRFDGH